MDLAHFLGGNVASEWNDTPHSLVPSTAVSSQPPCNDCHLHHPTHTRGAPLKAPFKPMATVWAKPWPRGMPNPVDQADDWIQVQMRWVGRHPQWWKELWALY